MLPDRKGSIGCLRTAQNSPRIFSADRTRKDKILRKLHSLSGLEYHHISNIKDFIIISRTYIGGVHNYHGVAQNLGTT